MTESARSASTPQGSDGRRDQSPASTRTSSLRWDERITPSRTYPQRSATRDDAAFSTSMISVMRSAPSSSKAQRVSSSSIAVRDAAPARRRRDDVPELDLAPLAVDVDRQREADEAPVVVERGEGLARAVERAPPRSGRATARA